MNFLAQLFKSGASYSAICTARSALSSYLELFDGRTFGELKEVKRFIKGVYELRPSLPKYSSTWNVDIMFEYLKLLIPHDKLTLKELTHKLVMLLALLTGQRCQTITHLSLSSMKMFPTKCVFSIEFLIKQSRRGRHLAPIELLAFPDDKDLCVVSTLKEYITRTKDLRGNENQLLISYQKPHTKVTSNTVARWLRDMMTRAGIDTNIFGAHSTRGASTSAAINRGTPMDTVMKAAGWSSESTFTRFYKKPATSNMGQTLLDKFINK